MAWNSVLISILCVIVVGYYYLRKKFNYWADRGVPFVKPEIPFGNLRGLGTKYHMGHIMTKAYNELSGKNVIGGMYFYTEPVVVALDLDLLRNIFVKDFQYFTNRGVFFNERDDPLSAHMFATEDEQWRTVRTKLSPTFTSGKMKMMHPTVMMVADQLTEHLHRAVKQDSDIDVKEVLAKFTTDVICNVAFGVECNSLKDPDSAFRRAGRLNFEFSAYEVFKMFFGATFPKLARTLRMKMTKPEVSSFMLGMIKETVAYREQNNVQRNDFMSLLLQLKNNGKLDGEKVSVGKLTFNELAAQVFAFFIAGFETSASTMTFAAYELTLNPDIQRQAREEIREVLAKHNGEMSYEAIMEMRYLDQIIHEALRKWPIAETLFRRTQNDYKVPNSKIVIERGTKVMIPVMGIQRDPQIYPDPERFDPDRFTKENVAERHPYSFIPFGEGPRNCVGLRFGLMQTRVGLATLLKDFELKRSAKTPVPLQLQPNAQVLTPVGGMVLTFTPL